MPISRLAFRARAVPAYVAGLLVVALAGAAADAQTADGASPRDDSPISGTSPSESSLFDTPPFPGMEITDAVRIHLGTHVAPEARVGKGHLTLVRPEFGLRVTWPATERLVLRVSARGSVSAYDFHGGATDVSRLIGNEMDLYAVRGSFEGSYRLDVGPWIADEEIWSVLGSVSVGSRWEEGRFDDGEGATGVLGFGYEVPGHLRLGLGVALRTSLGEGGVSPGPFFTFRWRLSDRVTLRSRELGLRLEFDLTPAVELHVSGFRASDSFRLRDRRGNLDELTFRDQQVRVGAGVDWTLANWLRLNLEAGAIADRQIRVHDDDLGTLASQRGKPSVFFDVRFEIRL